MDIDIIQSMVTNTPLLFAKALADETRQEIMAHLCCVWLSVNDVVQKLDGRVNQPTVSHHLKKLEDAGLVIVREDGRQRFYTLNQQELTICCGMLMRSFAPDYVVSTVPVKDVGVNK
jgi:ArsR family transcriptional regulator